MTQRDIDLESRIKVAYEEFLNITAHSGAGSRYIAPKLTRAELWRRAKRLATLQSRRRDKLGLA
ncbi:hypothetical protein LCGC14_2314440 [marine sediment metagenome]|uniref:Uncharacterized protein n=1 Tax=marine sediment metagenome TaxID=412755 RepID=A0A0F9D7A0_9ZZZZ